MPYLATAMRRLPKNGCCRGSGRTRRTTRGAARYADSTRTTCRCPRSLRRRAPCGTLCSSTALRTFRIECQRLKRRRLDHARAVVPTATARKGFAADLGQGCGSGGNAAHRNARHELFLRIRRAFPPLPDIVSENLERIWRLWDASQPRAFGAAWGHKYRDDMLRSQRARAAGDASALQRYLDHLVRSMQRAEITA